MTKKITSATIAEAVTELSTIGDLLRWAVSQFNAAQLYYGHGTDNAWDEATALLTYALHLPHDCDANILEAKLSSSEREAIVKLFVQRIEKRIPAPYLTHKAYFAGLEFYVDERVIIPRSPIAELLEQKFSPWLATREPQRMLDLCTGSACIAIAAAHAFPNLHIDAVDISEKALAVANINIEKFALTERVHLIQSDLFAELPKRSYDLIISNPPYVDAYDLASIPPEYQHEPKLALAAGHAGLDFVDIILNTAPRYLKEQGLLIVEVGNSQTALCKYYPELPFLWLEFERGGEGVFLLTKEQLDVR